MTVSRTNNLLPWIRHMKEATVRKLVYPGFTLSYHGICDCFLLSLFVIPSYFGVRLAFFDLTALRFFEILLLICIWKNHARREEFINMVRYCKHTVFIGLYFFVVVYTNLYHPSLNTIFYWLMNGILVFYLVAYLIITEYGICGFLKKLRIYAWVLSVISPLELVIGMPPFQLLDTLNKADATLRFGQVRIMGNCWEANSYAMYLCILLPFMCFDYSSKKVDIIRNKWIVLIVLFNIFMTGSRLTVGTSILILVLCYFLQNRKELIKSTIVVLIFVPILVLLVYAFRNLSFFRSLLCTFFSAFDQLFDTNYAVLYGADAKVLYDSARYRELLFQHTILDDWLNPIMGRGGSYVFGLYIDGYTLTSIDNYYVGQYITYAWPGVITWLLLSVSFFASACKLFLLEKSRLAGVCIISILCYFLSLWYLDQLQTFPIMLTVFALVFAISNSEKKKQK